MYYDFKFKIINVAHEMMLKLGLGCDWNEQTIS